MPRLTPKAIRKRPPKESGFLPWQFLSTAEDRLQAVVQKLPMILFALDQDGMVTLSEGRGLKGLGIKPGELVGRSVFDLYKNRPDILETTRRALDGESFVQVTELNGVVLETQFMPLFDKEGNFVGTIGAALDITERRKAEKALEESQRAMATLMTNLPGMAYRCKNDHPWTMEFVSEGCLELTGYQPRDLIQNRKISYNDVIHPDDRKRVWDEVQNALRVKQPFKLIYRIVTARKEEKTVWEQGRGVFSPEGRLLALEGFVADITDQKRAEQELRNATSEMEAIFQALPDLYFRVDSEGIIRDYKAANPEDLYLSPDKFLGKKMHEVLPGDVGRRFWHAIQKVLETKSVVAIEYTLAFRKDEKCFEARLTPLQNDQVVVIVRNITRRKHTEMELLRQKGEEEVILNSVPAMIWYKDRNNRILRCNRLAAAARGVTVQEMEGHLTEEFYPDEAGKYHADDLEVINSGRAKLGIVEMHQVASGEKVWVKTDKLPYRDEKGQIVGVIVFAVDITERMKSDEAIRQSQEQLRDSEERYRALFEHNPLMIFTVDENGITRSVNEEGAVQLGYSVDELVGKPVLEIFHKDDREAVKRSFMDCLRNPDRVARWEFRKVRKSGDVLWVRETIRPVRSRDAGIVALIVCEDITEWKHAQQALSESEERYRQMFENNPSPMWVYDIKSLEFLAVNDAATRQYGYSRDEFLRMTIKDVRPAEDIPLLMRIITENPDLPRVAGPLRHMKKDGTLIQVEINSHGINFGGRKARVVLVSDVTERKKAEQALLHSQKLESVGILAGGIAHDFNNLLMGVLGNSDLALQKLEHGSKVEVHIQQIKNASLKAAELCRQLLAYSGKGRFDVSFLDLNTMIKELMTLLELSIHKGITLRLNLDPALPAVLGDKVQVQQVIMNLVINSSEAIGDREGEIFITTKKVRADKGYLQWAHLSQDLREGDYILFEVKDTGCGMEPETVQRIFDPFFTTKFTGRGLGLAAVLGIVKGHGGAIRVDSEKGVGTTFKILIPSQEQTPPAPEKEEPPPSDEWKGEGTILVVDDEEAVRAVSELMLPTLGFGVLTAADGYKACEILREHEAEVVAVLLDLTMPRMDGAKAMHELRKIKPGVKVLLMSGYDEKEAVNRFTNEGFDSFLQKPFVRKQLQSKLKAMIEG